METFVVHQQNNPGQLVLSYKIIINLHFTFLIYTISKMVFLIILMNLWKWDKNSMQLVFEKWKQKNTKEKDKRFIYLWLRGKRSLYYAILFLCILFQLLHKDRLNVRQKGLCTSVFHWMQCNCLPSLRKSYQIIAIFFTAILLKKWYTLAERKKNRSWKHFTKIQRMGLKCITWNSLKAKRQKKLKPSLLK